MLNAFNSVSDTTGKYATINGKLILLFLAAAFATTAATAGAAMTGVPLVIPDIVTKGDGLTSFWSTLYTNPTTGEAGVGEFARKMGIGSLGFLGTGFDLISSGVGAAADGENIWGALKGTWNEPLEIGVNANMAETPNITKFEDLASETMEHNIAA